MGLLVGENGGKEVDVGSDVDGGQWIFVDVLFKVVFGGNYGIFGGRCECD